MLTAGGSSGGSGCSWRLKAGPISSKRPPVRDPFKGAIGVPFGLIKGRFRVGSSIEISRCGVVIAGSITVAMTHLYGPQVKLASS